MRWWLRAIGASVIGTLPAVRACLGQEYVFGWDTALSESGVEGHAVSAAVYAMEQYDDYLIVGGTFDRAGSLHVASLAAFDGANWWSVGDILSGSAPGTVVDLAVFDGALFVAGEFSSAGGVAASVVASFDGGGWSAAASGLPAGLRVESMVVNAGRLFLAGYAPAQSPIEFSARVWRWESGSWIPFGPEFIATTAPPFDTFASPIRLLATASNGLGGVLLWGGDCASESKFACGVNEGLHQYVEGATITVETVPPNPCPQCPVPCRLGPVSAPRASADVAGVLWTVGKAIYNGGGSGGDWTTGPVERHANGVWIGAPNGVEFPPPNLGTGHPITRYDPPGSGAPFTVIGGQLGWLGMELPGSGLVGFTDGGEWTLPAGGLPVPGVVYALCEYKGFLFVGGAFAFVGPEVDPIRAECFARLGCLAGCE